VGPTVCLYTTNQQGKCLSPLPGNYARFLGLSASSLVQSRTNSGNQIALATKRCTVLPTSSLSSVCNLLHFILLTPRILRWFLEFWKIRAPLVCSHQLDHGNVQQVYGTSTVFTYVRFPSDGSGMHVQSSTLFVNVSTADGSTGCVADDSSVKVPTNTCISNVIFLFWYGRRLVNHIRHVDAHSYI
jgi:hypothetical protein